MTKTLSALRASARAILDHAIAAVDPYAAVCAALRVDHEHLVAADRSLEFRIKLSTIDSIYVVGCGKAGARMSLAVEHVLGERVADGAVAIKYGHRAPVDPARITLIEAEHPRPDENSCFAARQALTVLDKAGKNDLVIALISGGGSSLWTSPAAGISLQDKRETTEALLRCGATIQQINCVRKHLSAIKGGFAAYHAAPAQVLSLVISDVIGDNLDIIASGPFVPDPTTFADAWNVLRQYDLTEAIPSAVRAHISEGAAGGRCETPKPGEAVFPHVHHMLCADNTRALCAAAEKAASLGFRVVQWPHPLSGESQLAAEEFCRTLQSQLSGNRTPLALIAGGETTVTLGSSSGTGGRNQECALAASLFVRGTGAVVVASCGTDGTDGPTDAAGGLIDSTTYSRGAALGLDVRAFIDRHDSYHFLQRTGDLIVTGPTGTNVMDIQLALALPEGCGA